MTSFKVHAEIPSELYSGMSCRQQVIQSQNSDSAVIAVDAVLCRTLYSDIQFVEVAIKNLAFDKKIYVYDRADMYEFERAITVRLVQGRYEMNDGAAIYLGTTEDGYDRFVISLYSVRRPEVAPAIDIFVKMAGGQFQSTMIQLVPAK